MLSSHVIAEYFPLLTGSRWTYSGTMDGEAVTTQLVAQAGGVQAGLSTVRLRQSAYVPGQGTVSDDNYYALAADGLRFMRLADTGISDLRFADGVQVAPAVATDGRAYVSTKTLTGTIMGLGASGSITLTTTVRGIENIVVPAGDFQALHLDVRLDARVNVTGGWIQLSADQSIWLGRSLGMLREVESSDITSSEGEHEHLDSDLRLASSNRLNALGAIQVLGSGLVITPGDTTPTTTDSTAFGSLDVSVGSRTRVFTVRNTSAAAITLAKDAGGHVARLAGLHSSDYTLVQDMPTNVLAPGQAATFSVRFDPSALGYRFATLGVVLDRAAPSPDAGYYFDIRGSGVNLGRIGVRRVKAPQPIVSGLVSPSTSTGTFFGSVVAAGNATSTRNYVITNVGLGNLVLTGSMIRVEGASAPDFVVVIMPTSPVAPGATTTMRVVFNPSAIGSRVAVIRVFSNDPGTPQFWFTIAGNGL